MANPIVSLALLVIVAVSSCYTSKGSSSKMYQTLIVMTLDESGSMDTNKHRTMSAYNEFLQGQMDNHDTEAYLSLIKFSGLEWTPVVRTVHGVRTIESVDQLTNANYRPSGCTPLYDAIALAIDTAEGGAINFDQVIIVIMTDGQENCSK